MTPMLPMDTFKGWVVLVVDDEEDSLELARVLLETYGATVHTARDGREALLLLRTIKPRFIISDLSMPHVDGWDFVELLQQDVALREIPVIALTAHVLRGHRERAIAAGFQNYLLKPLTAETFIYKLAVLLVDIPDFSPHLCDSLTVSVRASRPRLAAPPVRK